MIELSNVKNWASILDPNTLEQAEMLSRCPVISGHVALMPDAHFGLGATVGSVIPTKDAIIPAAVGVDIGCGMIAVETNLYRTDLPEDLTDLHRAIARAIPAGVGQRHEGQQRRAAAWLMDNPIPNPAAHPKHEKSRFTLPERALKQLGSLGSGNHFVEICVDERGVVWAVLHSGSRGVGNILALHHCEIAKNLIAGRHEKLENPDLAYFLEEFMEFDAYIADMLWAQAYARENREIMMDNLLVELAMSIQNFVILEETQRINCHHNFSQLETHFGQEVWLTRKGAIKADVDDWGIIPGSMGTHTYIVQGLGNVDSYKSSPHGAGRVRSRGAAKRELSVDELNKQMAHCVWNQDNAKKLLDEAPDAYKDIEQVMEDSKDLVTPIHSLIQILNYKGI